MGNRRLRPFRSIADVKRMMRRWFGMKTASAESLDPLTVAAFIGKADRFHGAFNLDVGIPVGDIEWPWWLNAADMLLVTPSAANREVQKTFWSPGQSILPPSGASGVIPSRHLTGWYFLPETIVLQFFDGVTTTRKAGHVKTIWSYAAHIAKVPGTVQDPRNLLLLGKFVANGTQEIQPYSVHPCSESADEASQPLYPFPLIAGNTITFSDISGVAEGDRMTVSMTGLWIFDPRYMTPEDEPDR